MSPRVQIAIALDARFPERPRAAGALETSGA